MLESLLSPNEVISHAKARALRRLELDVGPDVIRTLQDDTKATSADGGSSEKWRYTVRRAHLTAADRAGARVRHADRASGLAATLTTQILRDASRQLYTSLEKPEPGMQKMCV